MARLIQIIEVVTTKGKGVPGDPIRQVAEYWTLDGKLLATEDCSERLNVSESSVPTSTKAYIDLGGNCMRGGTLCYCDGSCKRSGLHREREGSILTTK